MKRLNDQIQSQVYESFKKSTQFSLSVGAVHKGRVVYKNSFGKPFKYYDLASMTKAIFTASYFIYKDLIHKKVNELLPWAVNSKLKVKDLLNHSTGLKAHIKFYKALMKESTDERQVLLKKLLRDELELKESKTSKSLYSDLGFILLGFCIEELEGKSFEKVFLEYSKEQGLSKDLHFNMIESPLKFSKSQYAPTEKCPWREQVLQGRVLDGNAYAMGGAGGHAGLFGTLEGMLKYGQTLRGLYKRSPQSYKKQTEGFANGFMVPSGKETTAGSLFSKQSIGHLGFTGVSFWYDPEVDLFITILSNRTFPDRTDSSFNKFRPIIQNLVYKEIVS